MPIGKIKRIKLRDVWKHEALNFTRWLEENVDVLNDALDLNLVSLEREQSAGEFSKFSVDLVGEDTSGRLVVIENQLEKSDHDHLGKLITYLTSLEAHRAVWIVGDPRPEHVKAISWLNESNSADFYLVKVEAICIGDSPGAPLLTLITGPSEDVVRMGKTKKEVAARYQIRERFWSQLLEKSKTKTKLHSNIKPGKYNWIGSSAGLPNGLGLNYAVRQNDAQAELYIDAGQDKDEWNHGIFLKLMEKRSEIEKEFGGELEWEALEGKRACRIKKRILEGGWQDEAEWPGVHEKMIDAMIALEKSLRPHLKKLS